MRVGAAAFLAVRGRRHRDVGLAHQIVEFQRLDQIAVPDQRFIGDVDVLHPLVLFGEDLDPFVHQFLIAEHRAMLLHRLLHIGTDSRCRRTTLRIAEVIQPGQREIGAVGGQFGLRGSGLEIVLEVEAGCAAEHHEINQRVRAKAVCPVHRNASRLAHGVKAGDDVIGIAIRADGYDLPVIVTLDAAHVVMHRRRNRQRLTGEVYARKNLAAFGDARQTLCQHLGIDMIEVQVDMIAFRPHAAPFAHFQRHRPRHDIAAGEVLCRRRVAFHEAFAFGIGEVSTLPACAFGDQHAGAVNAGRVELHEFHVLQRQAGAQHHTATITGAGVGRGCGVVAAAITAGRQHHALRAEAVDRAVIQTHRHHADASLHPVDIGHDQIECKIFDEEVRGILQALLVQRVKHGVASAVGCGASTLHRRAIAHVLHVPAERPLVDRAIGIAAERNACVLQFVNRLRGFAHEIFDCVLIAQPIRPLDGVIHVPLPVIGRVVAEAGRDPALSGNRVRARGEHLGNVRGAQARFGCARGCAQARAPGANNHHVIGMVNNLVRALQRSGVVSGCSCHQAAPVNARLATLKIAKAPAPNAARLSAESSANFEPGSWM